MIFYVIIICPRSCCTFLASELKINRRCKMLHKIIWICPHFRWCRIIWNLRGFIWFIYCWRIASIYQNSIYIKPVSIELNDYDWVCIFIKQKYFRINNTHTSSINVFIFVARNRWKSDSFIIFHIWKIKMKIVFVLRRRIPIRNIFSYRQNVFFRLV